MCNLFKLKFSSLQKEAIILWVKRDVLPSKLLIHLTNADDILAYFTKKFLSWNSSNISVLYRESVIKPQAPVIHMARLAPHSPSYADVFTVGRELFCLL